MRKALLLASVTFLWSTTSLAQPVQGNLALGQPRSAQPLAQKHPYRDLFQTPPLPGSSGTPQPPRIRVLPGQLPEARGEAHRARPKVVCGMTIFPADPSVDPGIRVNPAERPDNVPTEFTIRLLKPDICAPQP